MTHIWWSIVGVFAMFGIVFGALAYAIAQGTRDEDDLERYGGMTDAEVDDMINGARDDDPMGR